MSEQLAHKSHKHISQRLYLTHIVQHLYGKYPETEFSFKIIPYHGRKSLKISWVGNPGKDELQDFMDMYRGATIDKDGIFRQTETLFTLPGNRMVMVNWGFDAVILAQSELTFI